MIAERDGTALFAETLGVLRVLVFSRLTLSVQQLEELEDELFLWFDRFLRRPGTPRMERKLLQVALVSSACALAAFRDRQHAVDPHEIARGMGLELAESERWPEA